MKPPLSLLERASSVASFLATRLALVLASALVAATVNDVVEIGFEHRAWAGYVEPVPSPARTPTQQEYVDTIGRANVFDHGEDSPDLMDPHGAGITPVRPGVAIVNAARFEAFSGREAEDSHQQARILPVFLGGKPIGFRVMSLSEDSELAMLGFVPGDLVTRVNDAPVTTPEEALSLYQNLKTATEIRVEIQRNGQPMTLTYWIDR